MIENLNYIILESSFYNRTHPVALIFKFSLSNSWIFTFWYFINNIIGSILHQYNESPWQSQKVRHRKGRGTRQGSGTTVTSCPRLGHHHFIIHISLSPSRPYHYFINHISSFIFLPIILHYIVQSVPVTYNSWSLASFYHYFIYDKGFIGLMANPTQNHRKTKFANLTFERFSTRITNQTKWSNIRISTKTIWTKNFY